MNEIYWITPKKNRFNLINISWQDYTLDWCFSFVVLGFGFTFIHTYKL